MGLSPHTTTRVTTRPVPVGRCSLRSGADADTRPGVAMASYHLQINTGAKGAALDHSRYIQREGRYTEEKHGEVAARGQGNFPVWAQENPGEFWSASDRYERANGNTYREYELALPRELSREQQVALVERFAAQELGSTRPYQWAIHTPTARDGREQPHVHLMFSDRQLDGIERGPEQFFKRYNAAHPEKGGCRKATYGANKEEAARVYEGIRERWATIQNQALEQVGVEVRVDHRSLADQGIRDREPELHRGPAVSGIEARGVESEVGRRQREQRQERALAREGVVAEVRVVTREEMALERVAVRERRELAQEVTGEDRKVVLKRVEADRREQIERAQATAERRVERRQELGVGGQLVEQARALRERIGQQLNRVKEWVLERFPEAVERLKSLGREAPRGAALGGTAAGRPAAASIDLAQVKARGRAASDQWRQDLHQQQAAEKLALLQQRERERVVKEFQELAQRRAQQRLGYQDRSPEWKATPAELRQAIDRFNTQSPAQQSRTLERMAQQEAPVRELQLQMTQRRQLVRQLERGLER